MAENYQLFVHAKSLASLPKSGKNRESVIAFLDYLEGNHHLGSEIQEFDPSSGRTFFVSIISGYSITWWVDSPVREVKVVRIDRMS